MKKKVYVCPECKKVSPYYDAKFCTFCGSKITKDDLKELPICPATIEEGHCDDCLKKKAKECDNCFSKNEVKYRPEYNNRCLCYDCRMTEATIASLSKSY